MSVSSGFLTGQIADLRKQLRALQIDVSSKANSGANTDITSLYLNNTGLKVKDTNGTHGLIFKPGSDQSADRTLSFITGDFDRALTLTADASLGGTNTGDQTITLTGDVSGSGSSSFPTTLASVNSSIGTFGSSTQVTQLTVNAKGLITAASNVTISGVAPGGAAGGDLAGSYPNPSIGTGKVTNSMLAGNIAASKLIGTDITTVGTITAGIWSSTIAVNDNVFTLKDNIDNTKQAQFQLSGITTGTTRTFTLPDVSAPLVALSGISQRFELYTVTSGADLNTMFIGRGSGRMASTGTDNTVIGPGAGTALTSGSRNFIMGSLAGVNLNSGNDNVVIGWSAGSNLSSGINNTYIGSGIATVNGGVTGSNNTFCGYWSGRFITGCSNNALFGAFAGNVITSGSQNTCLGTSAGSSLTTATGCVMLGYSAGSNETGSNKLYIANSNTSMPLIYGDFSTVRLGIGGVNAPTAKLHLVGGTASASSAPLKFTSGTLNTTAEAGAQEYNNSFYQTKNSGLRYGLGGSIADFTSDANNSGTGETDLYSYTTPASTLAVTGEKLIATYCGTFNDATATAQIKAYFAGTAILDTGAITLSATGAWTIDILIIRTGASTARTMARLTTPTASTAVYSTQTDLTGLTFTNTNILKITGTSGGVGGGSNDITAKLGSVNWMAAAA